jgi:transcriptional regulator with XRE-family HTH domain
MEAAMVSAAQALDVRSKMIGVLLRAARLRAGKSMTQCADWLGCSPHIVSQFEFGRRAISLPELELLSGLYAIPVNHLWDEDLATIEEPSPRAPAEELLALRHKEVGVLLRQGRTRVGMTQAECAELLGVSAETIGKYEYGHKPVPFAELEVLAETFEIPLDEFLDRSLPAGQVPILRFQGEMLSAEDSWLRLPGQIRDFIRSPDSLPFLHMALGLYRMPKDSLRHLAEAMLSAQD